MAKFIEVTEIIGRGRETHFINIDFIIDVTKVLDRCCIHLNKNDKDFLSVQDTTDLKDNNITEINHRLFLQIYPEQTYDQVVEMIKTQIKG